jgi:hypothetical protein
VAARARRSELVPRPFLRVLVASVVVEVLLLRLLFRVGVFIPKDGAFGAIHGGLVMLGTFAFNLASLLTFAVLGWFAVGAFRRGRGAVGTVLALFLGGALLALAGIAEGPAPRLAFALAVGLIAWPALRAPEPVTDGSALGLGAAERLAIALSAIALLLSSYSGIPAALRTSIAGSLPGDVAAHLAGEVAVVGACLAFVVARWREGPVPLRAVILGALPALALVLLWRANGAVTGILVLWAAGLRLYLPLWLYVLAVWALGTTVVARMGNGSEKAAGLVLLASTGLLLESTYAQALALLALILLTDGRVVGGDGIVAGSVELPAGAAASG